MQGHLFELQEGVVGFEVGVKQETTMDPMSEETNMLRNYGQRIKINQTTLRIRKMPHHNSHAS